MPNTFELIASSTVGSGGASSIEFTSIPSTYTDIAVVISARSTGTYGNGLDLSNIELNGSLSSITDIQFSGSGTNASSSSQTNLPLHFNGSDSTANTFGNAMYYIPNYAGSNNKSVSADVVYENNATLAFVLFHAALRSNTAAITSFKFATPANGNFAQYSTAYLYGVKNA